MKRTLLATAIAATTATLLATPAQADPLKSWVVYCEGYENGEPVAYVTETVWHHADKPQYRADIATKAAQTLAETRTAPLGGCSSVPFYSDERAWQSQEAIVQANALSGIEVINFEIEESYAARNGAELAAVSARSSMAWRQPDLTLGQ